MKQQRLFKDSLKHAFGGELLKNSHAKVKRPYSPKASMHIVLKAKRSCLKHYDRRIERIIENQARRLFVRLYSLKNVGNHIHLVIKVKNKDSLSDFLRAVCGLIPRTLKTSKLWLQRPYSRIVSWGKDYRSTKNYMTINNYQSMGYSKQQARFMLAMDQGLIDLEAG